MKNEHIRIHVILVRKMAFLLATIGVMMTCSIARANFWELSTTGVDNYAPSPGGSSGAFIWDSDGGIDGTNYANSTNLILTVSDGSYYQLNMGLSSTSGSGSKTVDTESSSSAYATWTDSAGDPGTEIVSTANVTGTLTANTQYECDSSASVSGYATAAIFDTEALPSIITNMNGVAIYIHTEPDSDASSTATNGASFSDTNYMTYSDTNDGVIIASNSATLDFSISYTNYYGTEGGETSLSATNAVQANIETSFEYDGDMVSIDDTKFESAVTVEGTVSITLYDTRIGD